MEYLTIGIVVAANIVFVFFKFDKGRTPEAVMDLILLIVVTLVFSGSYGALVVGTVASLLISIYLYAKPPKVSKYTANLPAMDKEHVDYFVKEFKRRSQRRYQ